MYLLKIFNVFGKTFFPTVFTIFRKEKISFYCYFNPKSIKFSQGPLGLGPTGPCDNQALIVLKYLVTHYDKSRNFHIRNKNFILYLSFLLAYHLEQTVPNSSWNNNTVSNSAEMQRTLLLHFGTRA